MNHFSYPTNNANKEVICELRRRFEQNGISDKITRCDLTRLANEDWWPMTFLVPYKMDVDIAFAVLLECLKWRTSFDVHHISLLELKTLLDRRLAYIHGKDLNGRSILWINMSQHRSGDRAAEKLLVYWLERHTTERHGAPLTVFFDMTASGLQNMDLDFMKFLLRAFKYYYPCCLASLLVFENPNVLNASWKLVRSWMDSDTQRLLQHVTRTSVPNFVPPLFLPLHMGGEDEFIFTMDELARCIPSQSSSETPIEQHIVSPDLDNFSAKRAVKFGEEDAVVRSAPLNVHSRSASITKRNGGVPATLKPLAEARVNAASSNSITTKFLSICPREELTLNRVDGETDSVDIVVLKNISTRNVMYKIKITSPEKFRVRPSIGVVAPGATELIRVYLQNEYKHSVNREKFLLMALETDAKTSEEFSNAWKSADESCRVEHKLRCRLADNNDPVLPPHVQTPTANHIRSPASIEHPEHLRREIANLAGQQRILLICIVVMIILQLISLGCQRSYHLSLLTAWKEQYSQVDAAVAESFDVDSEL
uniref:Major sperm protein n=2 Tax=Parascaris univalens TaxID=6257 RepID=A0A915ASJ5_PARUN